MAKLAPLSQFKDMLFGSKTASMKLGEILNQELKLDLDWDYQRCEFYSDEGTNGIENTLACFNHSKASGTRLIEKIKKRFGESSDIYLQQVEGEGYAVVLGQKYLSKLKPREAFPEKLKPWLDFANWESERLEVFEQDKLLATYDTLSTEVMPNKLAELLFEKLENERSRQRLEMYEYKLVRYANGSRIHRVPSSMPYGADELGALTDLSRTLAPAVEMDRPELIPPAAAVAVNSKSNSWISGLKYATTALVASALTYFATIKEKVANKPEMFKEPMPIEQKVTNTAAETRNGFILKEEPKIPLVIAENIIPKNNADNSSVLIKSEPAVVTPIAGTVKPLTPAVKPEVKSEKTGVLVTAPATVKSEEKSGAVPEKVDTVRTAADVAATFAEEFPKLPNLEKYFAEQERAQEENKKSTWYGRAKDIFDGFKAKLDFALSDSEILGRFSARADKLTLKTGRYEDSEAQHSWVEGRYRLGDRLNATYLFSGLRLTDFEPEPYAGVRKDFNLNAGPIRAEGQLEYVLANPEETELSAGDNLEIARGSSTAGLKAKLKISPQTPYYDSAVGFKFNPSLLAEVIDPQGEDIMLEKFGVRFDAEQVLVANPEITRDLYAAASIIPGIDNNLSAEGEFGVTGSLALKGRWGNTFGDAAISARADEGGLSSGWSVDLNRYLSPDTEFGIGYGSDSEMWPNAFGDMETDPKWRGFKATFRKRF